MNASDCHILVLKDRTGVAIDMPVFKIICFLLMYTFFDVQLRETPFVINKRVLWVTEFFFLIILFETESCFVFLFFILTVLSLIDIKHYEIPSFSYAYVTIGVLYLLVASSYSIFSYLIKVIIVFSVLFILDLILNLKMGGADLKLLIILVPLINVFNIISFLYLMSFFAILTWIIKSLFTNNKKWSLKEPIPLIPAISIALFLVL